MSLDGGESPRWRADGRELFYVAEGRLMAVSIDTESDVQVGVAEDLFSVDGFTAYDVSADGSRFVFVRSLDDAANRFVVVQNWFAEFAARPDL